MIAVHLGIIDEEQINNMSYIFFEDILEELGHKLNYDAVVNFAGNSFCEKSWDMIQESNPMNTAKDPAAKAMEGVAHMFNSANVRVGRI